MKWQKSEISRNWETQRIVRLCVYLKISDSLGHKEGSETYENGLGFIRHTFYVSENEMRVEIFLLDTFFSFYVCLFAWKLRLGSSNQSPPFSTTTFDWFLFENTTYIFGTLPRQILKSYASIILWHNLLRDKLWSIKCTLIYHIRYIFINYNLPYSKL